MKKLLIICILFLAISCSNKEPIIIKPFTVMNRIDTFNDRGKKLIYKTDFFLIHNYKDVDRYNNYIDSFLRQQHLLASKNYEQYTIVLYKESDKTNMTGNKYSLPTEKYKKYTDDEDVLFNYIWFKNGNLSIGKFKNGQSIDPKNPKVKITDVKR